MFEIRSPTLTLKELDTNKVLIVNHDAVRVSTRLQPEILLKA